MRGAGSRARLSSPTRPDLATAVASGRQTLATLAALINDALMTMGAQPAFNGPSAARQAAVQTAPSVSPGRRKGRPLHPLHAADDPAPGDRLDASPQPKNPETGPAAKDAGTIEAGIIEAGMIHADRVDAGMAEAGMAEAGMAEDHVETWRLVRLAQGGDGEAFGRLYDRYVDAVFRFVFFRVNDRALAEDFTSETFLRALRRIGSITYQGRDIGAWFITIARNIVLDHMKSARHRLEITTADTVESKEVERSTEATVLDTLQSEGLMAAVGKLGDEQRECVMLRFMQGLSVSETADVMGKNDGAIKALQHRAVRKLADLIGNDLR